MTESNLLKPSSDIADVLYRIRRGLSGYVSYLAACEMNVSFSEYVLYEPTLRILTARGFSVECEHPCPGGPQKVLGDVQRLDFVATKKKNGADFAIEMKWKKNKRRLDVRNDVEKLKRFRKSKDGGLAFLCIFGRKSFLAPLVLNPAGLQEHGKALYAEFGKTKYGCRIYEVT